MRPFGTRTRRDFLKDSLAAAAAVGAMTEFGLAQNEKKTPQPRWLIACRDAHLKETNEPDAWKAMSAIDVDGAEVTVTLTGECPGLYGRDKPYSIAKPDDVKALAEDLARRQKKISAFCLHNNFDGNLEPEIECVKMTARAAKDLGVPAVRLDVQPHKIKDQDEFLKFAIKTGKRIVEVSEGTEVRFGVENHGGTTNKPEFLKPLFEGVGSRRFGLTLDTANFYWFGHPLSKLYDLYQTLAPNVCHTHCKSIKYPEGEREKQRPIGWEYGKYCCPIYEGDIDFKKLAAILRKAGYQGDLCIENESLGRFPKEQRKDILTREAAFLRKVAQNT
jgi:sugar phosphate isomerase/epimerase